MVDYFRKARKILKHTGILLLSVMTFLMITNLPTLTHSYQAIAQNTRSEIRGVWLTNNDFHVMRDRAKLSAALTQLKQLNFNTIYPVVWNGGYVNYPSVTAQKAGIQPFIFRGTNGEDILREIINQGHRQGLLVIPWFEFGFMAPPTSELAVNHKSWLTQRRNRSLTSISVAGEVVWLNPFHPEVQEFLTNLVLEAVNNYDIDGVQFDDHMSLPNEFGYDNFTMNLYRREAALNNRTCRARRGRPAPKRASKSKAKPSTQPVSARCTLMPLEPSSNPDNPQWVKWRADKITQFMGRLNKAVKARKPQAIFSVSPNYYDFAYKEQLQDWLNWVRLDIVDEIIVQVYRQDLQSFLGLINRPEMAEVQKKVLTAVAILSGLKSNPAPLRQIQPQVQAVRDRNLGISFFYFGSLWGYGPEINTERQLQFSNFFRYRPTRVVDPLDLNNPFIN